ncbi:hypothetical protein PMAYCL1PPCAC_07630, partial [Pristionchus mayeri]
IANGHSKNYECGEEKGEDVNEIVLESVELRAVVVQHSTKTLFCHEFHVANEFLTGRKWSISQLIRNEFCLLLETLLFEYSPDCVNQMSRTRQ